MINKHNNISSQDALFNNVSIRDTLKSDSIEANQIIRSANPGSTGRIILNGTLTVLGNDNSIDTIKNVNITNNELEFTNESGTTTANKITQENGITNITGGNITFNHTLKVTGDNNNVTTISDANIANNKEIEFINENGNTTIDNITGESTITNGNISFNNVVTVKNEQNNQNNITSITSSNITNNKEINFTNQTANSLIDNITGESSINSGNISFDNLVTVKNQQNNQNNITSITDSNINNNNSMSFTNQTANTTIDNIIGESTITGGNITSNNVVTVKNQQNDNNNITSITNSTITNDNEIEFTNPTANTIIDTLQDGEGNLTITGGNITSNNIITVKNEQNDNNNITSITDSNLTNNNSLTFTKQTANTAIDNLQAGDGELTITGGDISFDNVVTIKNQQDNQNNITSISNSNINNNNSMSFTNETANTTIDTLQKGEGDLTITGGNINTNNIITVTDQSVITSLTNANITNSGTLTLNNASIDQLITSNINGHKTLNDSLKETKFKYKEETLKKSTDTVTGTKYYNIPYVKEIDNVTYYGELVNKTEELNTSHVNYDMKYYYADIIYYQYQNKIIIPENQSVNVNKADQISLVNADVTNNGTLNISDGSVIQEIIGDVKFSGKVNLEAVTEIRDVDNIILEEAIITNNKGINITGESTISSIIDSNIGGDVTIDTKGHATVNNVVNSTITNGTVTINDNITSTVTNSNLVGGTVNFGENKTLTVDVKAGTLENEIIKTITDSTINNAKVTLNNNITSTVTNSDLNATTIDLNNNTLTTKEGVTSSFNNIDNSTITNGNVSVNNDLDSLITNSTLKDNVTINLNTNSLNAKTGSSVIKIDNSTITNGNVSINDSLNTSLANVVLGDNENNNVKVNLNSNLLTANSGSSVSEINKSTITNGTVTIKNELNSSLANVVLGDNVNNDVKVNLNSNTLTAETKSSISKINKSTITNGTVTVNNSLNTSLANVVLGDNVNNDVKVNLNSNTLTANNSSSISDIKKSTITNGTVTINENLSSLLTDVALGDNVIVNLSNNSLNATTVSSISNINNSTLTNGTLTINNDITSQVTNSNIENGTVDLNNHKLTANGDITLINITGGVITNTGTLEANGTITANQINSNLLKDQTGTNQIMAYDKDNKKITFCNHTTLTCSGTEDTLTTDNLVIDRITLNEVREVDGGIITTGLKVGFPYWTDLGTTEQGSTINIEGNILHVVKVLVDGVNHYQLWISMMDIEFSLKSTGTKIITKGTTFEGSVLINSLDDLTLGENEHLYIQSANVPIANGKMLNDMVINASINADGTITGKSLQLNNASINNGVITGKSLQLDNASINTDGTIEGNLFNGKSLQLVNASISEDGTITGKSLHFDNASIGTNGVITGKSLQTNQISNENGDKSIIKYESGSAGINPKITIGSENVDLEIIGFDQKNINCDTLTASNYVKSNLLQSNDENNKQIIKYEPGSADINPKITIGSEGVDLEIVGFDQKNIVCDTLKTNNYVQSDLLQSKDGKQIIKYEPAGTGTNPKITLGSENVDLEIVGFDQKNIVCETLTATKRIRADIFNSSDDTISIIGQIGAILQIGDNKNTSNIQVNFSNLMKIFGNLQITNSYRLRTDNIYSSDNNTPLIQLNSSTVTVGSQDKTTSIYNLNITHDLTVDNNIFADIIYSSHSTTTPIFNYDSTNKILVLGSNATNTRIAKLCTSRITDYLGTYDLFLYNNSGYLELGNAENNYLYTLIHKIKTDDPLYLSSLKYWVSSTDSISLINYDPLTKTITIGDSTKSTKQNTDNLTITTQLNTDLIKSSNNTMQIIKANSTDKTIRIGELDNTTISTYINTLFVDGNLRTDNIKSSKNARNIISYSTSGSTEKITIGSSSTTQKTHNLTVDTDLTVANRIYADSIYSHNNTEKPLIRRTSDYGVILGDFSSGKNFIYFSVVNVLYGYWNSTYQIFGEKGDTSAKDSYTGDSSYNYVFLGHPNYAYTLIYNLRTNEPLYTPSIYYWPLNTAKTSAIPLLVYDNTNPTITLGNTTTNISIPGTITSLKTNSIKDSENDSIISVDTEQDIITIGNNNKQTIIKNADYSDIFNKIYVSMGQNIKFKIDPTIAISQAIKTEIKSVTITKDGNTTTLNVNVYQNADNIYNNYTTGQIFLNREATSTDTTTEVDVYIIPKNRNFFNHPTNTGQFYTKQTARMCFVFCNLYFIIKTPRNGDETSSGLWTSSNGNVWYEFSPKDFNNKTGPYSDTTVSGAKFDILKTTQITNLSIGYIPRGWMTGYEAYEDHYVLGFPLITVNNEAYYAAFLLYDYDEYMTREVTYDGGCTIL